MKLKILIITLVVSMLLGTSVYADNKGEFILVGGDEFISTKILEEMGLESELEDGKVVLEDRLAFDVKETLVEAGRVYVPFKETMEFFGFNFGYVSKDEVIARLDDQVYSFDVLVRNEEVVAYEFDDGKDDMDDDKEYKDQVKLFDQKKKEVNTNVIMDSLDPLAYMVIDEEIYLNADSLTSFSIELILNTDGYFAKDMKSDEGHDFDFKDVYRTRFNGQLITWVPAEELLDAFDFEYDEDEKKLVVEFEDRVIIFHE